MSYYLGLSLLLTTLMDHSTTLLLFAIFLGFFMSWGIGANDVSNAMGTSVGSKALSIKQAIFVAAIFEASGAFLAGGQVTDTIRGKIIDASLFQNAPEIIVVGMLAALMAAAVWLFIASTMAWPVSTTHTIIGAIVGFGIVELGPSAIYWREIINIALSWIVTPFFAGVLSYLIFSSVQKYILATSAPIQNAKKYIPLYMLITCFVVSLVTTMKGIKHLGFHFSITQNIGISILFSIILTLIGRTFLIKIAIEPDTATHNQYHRVEKLFAVLMIFTACAMAFAHGSNDVANAIGPLAAVVSVIHTGQMNPSQTPIENWILLLGAVGIVVGLSTYGYRVISTVGEKITELTPSRGFAAELATASTVVIASGTGLPVSTTQTLVGAILGVGIARGIGALRLPVIRNIFLSWVITLPAGASLAIIFFKLISYFLNG